MTVLSSDIINFFKVVTFVVYSFAIYWYDLGNNQAAWMLLGTHGTYGLLWTSKTWFGYPDKSFETPAKITDYFIISFFLALYWLPMYFIVRDKPQLPSYLLPVIVALFGWGVYFHFTSDLHKVIFLKQREELRSIKSKVPENVAKDIPNPTFLKDNLWGLCLNPNYFGELLIYLSFSLCSMSIWPVVYLFFMMIALWIPNMRKKDASLSRFPDYVAYKRKSSRLIPCVW